LDCAGDFVRAKRKESTGRFVRAKAALKTPHSRRFAQTGRLARRQRLGVRQSSGAVARGTACQQNPSTVRALGRIVPGLPQSRPALKKVRLRASTAAEDRRTPGRFAQTGRLARRQCLGVRQSSGAVARGTACQQNPSTVRALGRIVPGFPQSRRELRAAKILLMVKKGFQWNPFFFTKKAPKGFRWNSRCFLTPAIVAGVQDIAVNCGADSGRKESPAAAAVFAPILVAVARGTFLHRSSPLASRAPALRRTQQKCRMKNEECKMKNTQHPTSNIQHPMKYWNAKGLKQFLAVVALAILLSNGCATERERTWQTTGASGTNRVTESARQTDMLADKIVLEKSDVLGLNVKTPGNSSWLAFTLQLAYAHNKWLTIPTCTNPLFAAAFADTGSGNVSLINQAGTDSSASASHLLPAAAYSHLQATNLMPVALGNQGTNGTSGRITSK
jgi:hypothetical protein